MALFWSGLELTFLVEPKLFFLLAIFRELLRPLKLPRPVAITVNLNFFF